MVTNKLYIDDIVMLGNNPVIVAEVHEENINEIDVISRNTRITVNRTDIRMPTEKEHKSIWYSL